MAIPVRICATRTPADAGLPARPRHHHRRPRSLHPLLQPRTKGACPDTVPVDIQASFTVLARRSAPVRKYEAIDLRRTCLRGLDAARAHLSSVTFGGGRT
jgi:hypothetical protein